MTRADTRSAGVLDRLTTTVNAFSLVPCCVDVTGVVLFREGPVSVSVVGRTHIVACQ